MALTKFVFACLFALPVTAAAKVCAGALVNAPTIELRFTGDPIAPEKRLLLLQATREVASWFKDLALPPVITVQIQNSLRLQDSKSGIDHILVSSAGTLEEFTRLALPAFLHELGHVILWENLPGEGPRTLADLGRHVLGLRQRWLVIHDELGPRFYEDMTNEVTTPEHLARLGRWQSAWGPLEAAKAAWSKRMEDHFAIAEVFADLIPVLYRGDLSLMKSCIDAWAPGQGAFRSFCENEILDPSLLSDVHNVLYRVRVEIGALLRAHPALPKRSVVGKIVRALNAGLARAARVDAAALYVRELRREFR